MIERIYPVICIAGAMLFASFRLVGAQDVKPVPVSGNIRWIYNYAEGQKIARETGKPILVVFRCER